MKLVIDIGNTNAKLAVYDLKRQVDFFVTPKEDFNKVTKQVFLKYEKILQSIIENIPDDINENEHQSEEIEKELRKLGYV